MKKTIALALCLSILAPHYLTAGTKKHITKQTRAVTKAVRKKISGPGFIKSTIYAYASALLLGGITGVACGASCARVEMQRFNSPGLFSPYHAITWPASSITRSFVTWFILPRIQEYHAFGSGTVTCTSAWIVDWAMYLKMKNLW